MNGKAAHVAFSARARAGIGLVTEYRSIFMDLTVRQNLRLTRGGVSAAVELFPELEVRLSVRAGLLSGGEQQMLSLQNSYRNPSVVLADELSQGLAPIVTKRLISALRQAADKGAAILLVDSKFKLPFTCRSRLRVASGLSGMEWRRSGIQRVRW